jgi:transcription initiation factor TFIID TATA-box-binding protein
MQRVFGHTDKTSELCLAMQPLPHSLRSNHSSGAVTNEVGHLEFRYHHQDIFGRVDTGSLDSTTSAVACEKVHPLPPCVEPPTTVHNMVCTCMICGEHVPINLQLLHLQLPNSSYDRKRFAAITIRMQNPNCTSLLFTSGKLVITGVKSWYECMLSAQCVCRLINQACPGKYYYISNCGIENIVAQAELRLQQHQKLDIQEMYNALSVECTYQCNMFPGLIYRAADAPIVLLCFTSGKVVLTGGKTLADVAVWWKILWERVHRFVY